MQRRKIDHRAAAAIDQRFARLLVSVEDRVIPIPLCYRSGDVVEPTLLSQWYVKMKPLAEPALECVEKGETRLLMRAAQTRDDVFAAVC